MASETGAAVVSEIVKSALVAAIHQARYFLCFNKCVHDLQREKTELTKTRDGVHERSEKAKEKMRKMDTVVINWMEQANSLIEEVNKLEEEANSNKSYCFGHFPNWIWRYHAGKLIVEKTKEAIELVQKSNFQEFSRPATPPGMKYFSSEGFIYFESTKMAYDKLLEALKDDDVSMIGLYGMGGCGKTTLAKQIGKEAEKSFNKVAFVVVSNIVDVEKIQGEIASYLNLEPNERESMSERGRTLWGRLTSGEKILIILDDVWEKLDFEVIGIPIGESRKGCKVLLTTRRLPVCTLMGCHRSIPLTLLNEDEAWTLFQMHSGIDDDASGSLMGLAKEITKECKGLPVAIAAVASTLKGKSVSEWEEAQEKLKEATPIDIEEGLRDPYKCLQLSYDNLRNEETKSLFLMCSIFPEDFEIHEEYLTIYGIGLGLFGEVSHYARARNKVSEAKNKLINSCLLLKGQNEQYVKMHDLVRDTALIIAKKEKKVIIGLESSGRNLILEDNTTIRYLLYFKTQEKDHLSYLQGCPKLEFLYVKILQNSILEDEVFKTMKSLRVLVIQGEGAETRNILMAKSLEWLTNLRCLFLNGWKLDDISFIGSLKRLESLVLWFCSFEELPNEITELSKLSLLNLHSCEIERNPVEVIRKCSQLEELYFLHNSVGWPKEMEIAVAAVPCLKRYRIDIGRSGYYLSPEEYFSITRGLWSNSYDALTSNAVIQDLAQRMEYLQLERMDNGCKNIIPDLVNAKVGGMNQLTELRLSDCDKIECLVDTSNPRFKVENANLSNLLKLYIQNMFGLKTLWLGPHEGKLNLCRSLKMLQLYYCPNLTSVFTCAAAQSLVVLEELQIQYCDGLKHIVSDEEKDNDKKYSALMLPKLQRLSVFKCDGLEYLIPVRFAGDLVRLESLSIIFALNLIHVFGQSSTNHEDHNQNRLQIINLPIFKKIAFWGLPNMKAMCPENYCPLWPSLKELSWVHCPTLKVESISKCIVGGSQVINIATTQQQQLDANVNQLSLSQMLQSIEKVFIETCELEGIFQLPEHPTSEDLRPFTLCLKYLKLYYLKELSYIFKGPIKFILLQNLQQLQIRVCEKLKFIFSATIIRSLPLLENLHIRDCPQLEQIIEDEETQEFLNHTETNKVNHWSEEFHNAPKKPGSSRCLSVYKWLSKPVNICKLKKYRKDQSREIAQDEKDQNLSINHSQQVCFPRLTRIHIEMCNNLKYLFVILSSHELPQLNELIVEECSLLENVFACKESNTEGEQAVMFSKLRKLRLRKLPNLVNVYKGFKWDSVNDKQVEDCPKLTSTTIAPSREHHNKESKEAHKTQTETPSMDGTSMSVNSTEDAIQPEKKQVQTQAALTDPKENKHIDVQTSASQDVNLTASLAQTNQEYQTSEKGGNVKKMEDKNATEKSTTSYPKVTETHETLTQTSLPESTLKADSVIKSDKINDIDKGRGDLQTQELNTSINHFNTEESLQEQNTNLREEIVKKTSKSDQVSLDHHQEAFEAQKVHLSDPTSGLDLNKENYVKQNIPQVNSQGKEEEFVSDSTFMEQRKTPDEMKGESSVDLPTPADEYATFRDIGEIKKKHIPLLEKAFAKYPSLWDWHKKFKRRQIKAIKQLGYTILGDMLEFLESTRWRDLTEEKKTEFESFVNDLEALGFDIGWLGNTCEKIKQSKLDERSIKQKRALEEQVAAEQQKVEEMKAHLEMAEAKLQKCKLELDAIEAVLGNYSDFIGF
ncbi:hypothetical protein L6164_026191 [Bauhinia variegata]|uniref:Uncharacterized protein n=1 Tax=Bauhinia variegata TaxID=167791 RepID=A0ACB9LQ64_BAUVA|nr:hypothetical protein L6164_026191 [Bauhinia variegata]